MVYQRSAVLLLEHLRFVGALTLIVSRNELWKGRAELATALKQRSRMLLDDS